jgi:hypothetical protein
MENPTCITNLPASGIPNFQYYIFTGDTSFQINGTFTWRGPLAAIVSQWPGRSLNCLFDFNDGTNWAQIDYGVDSRYSVKIPLVPNMSNVQYNAPGGFLEADIYVSSNVTVATLTHLQIGLEGADPAASGSLSAGTVTIVANRLAGLCGDPSSGFSSGKVQNWLNGYASGPIFVSTTAAAQPPGAFVGISIRVPNILLGKVGFGNLIFGATYSFITDDAMSGELAGVPVQVASPPLLVSALAAASAANSGFRYIVSDATTTTFGSIVAGTGANKVPVYSDGTNWRIG